MTDSDYLFALKLQAQFEHEASQTLPKSTFTESLSPGALLAENTFSSFSGDSARKEGASLSYKIPKKSALNSSKCLIDPSWEVIDPTPDIHVLFMSFNQRFFYNKLLSVCVSWSKRMTSCAGVCSYHGRGGMCKITLSEPLLKLRPRKDLVETLLHEMIHALLFVTHNNKDRDGHGPEFHKHMHRINAEAGTNISVYHDFIEEVRLYQQHWWRCDGPCKNWKPYFGTVRRATNRAPGPHDFWFRSHSQRCGGNFIKVKEPEKKIKPSKAKAEKPKSSSDIRKFITTTDNTLKDTKNTSTANKPDSLKYTTLKTLNNTTKSKAATTKSLPKQNKENTSGINKVFSGNSSNIFGFTNLNNPGSSKAKEIVPTITIPPVKNEQLATVRNHWANKYSDHQKKTGDSEVLPPPKKVKASFKECSVCDEFIFEDDFEKHTSICLKRFVANWEEDFSPDPQPQNTLLVDCLACGKKIDKSALGAHLDECMTDLFKTEVEEGDEDCGKNEDKFNCPICMELFPEVLMDQHLASCLK